MITSKINFTFGPAKYIWLGSNTGALESSYWGDGNDNGYRKENKPEKEKVDKHQEKGEDAKVIYIKSDENNKSKQGERTCNNSNKKANDTSNKDKMDKVMIQLSSNDTFHTSYVTAPAMEN